MVRTCFVSNCKTAYRSMKICEETGDECVTLFKAPKNASLRKKWELNCNRVDRRMTTKDYVCSKHFAQDCISSGYKVSLSNGQTDYVKQKHVRLRPNAIPTIFDHSVSESKKRNKLNDVTHHGISSDKKSYCNKNNNITYSDLRVSPLDSTATTFNDSEPPVDVSEPSSQISVTSNNDFDGGCTTDNLAKSSESVENQNLSSNDILQVNNVAKVEVCKNNIDKQAIPSNFCRFLKEARSIQLSMSGWSVYVNSDVDTVVFLRVNLHCQVKMMVKFCGNFTPLIYVNGIKKEQVAPVEAPKNGDEVLGYLQSLNKLVVCSGTGVPQYPFSKHCFGMLIFHKRIARCDSCMRERQYLKRPNYERTEKLLKCKTRMMKLLGRLKYLRRQVTVLKSNKRVLKEECLTHEEYELMDYFDEGSDDDDEIEENESILLDETDA